MIKARNQYLQKMFNLISFIFLFVRYRNRKDPFRIFKKISNANILIDKINKTLILVPFRVSPLSNLFEGLIGYYFKLKGYNVKAILCNQSVHYCENITYRDEKKRLAICALCLKEQKRFCSSFNIEPLNLNDYISNIEQKEINSFINNIDVLKEDAFQFRKVNFKKNVVSGVTRYTLKSDIDYLVDASILKGYLKTALLSHIAAENIFNKNKPDLLIMSHGIYSTWGSILNASRISKIPSYVWARGYVGQGDLMFGQNSSYLEDLILENKDIYQAFNYSSEDIENTKSYFKAKRNIDSKVEYVNYYSTVKKESYTLESFLKENRIIKQNKVFGMFTNIPWDGQIFNQTPGIPDTKFYVRTVVSWFEKNPDCNLIIRAHPAETDDEEGNGSEKFIDILNRLYPKLPDNVFFIPADSPITSYQLSEIIDAAVIYGSSIGLELAIAGIPVIQAGNFNTSLKGFVFEAADSSQLADYLNQCKNGLLKMTEDQIMNSIKFGNYWIYKRHIPDSTVILDRLIFQNFNFNSINEFINNDTLEFIYNKMETNSKIINFPNLI